jgi:hypothetical protein
MSDYSWDYDDLWDEYQSKVDRAENCRILTYVFAGISAFGVLSAVCVAARGSAGAGDASQESKPGPSATIAPSPGGLVLAVRF